MFAEFILEVGTDDSFECLCCQFVFKAMSFFLWAQTICHYSLSSSDHFQVFVLQWRPMSTIGLANLAHQMLTRKAQRKRSHSHPSTEAVTDAPAAESLESKDRLSFSLSLGCVSGVD
jgi:hypothetical protein